MRLHVCLTGREGGGGGGYRKIGRHRNESAVNGGGTWHRMAQNKCSEKDITDKMRTKKNERAMDAPADGKPTDN